MATRSKNTDMFKGLVSWVCFILVLCSVTAAVVSLLAVILSPTATESVSSLLQYLEYYRELPDAVFIPVVCVLALFVTALVFVFVFRQDRRQFEAAIARGLSRVWVEVKLAFIVLTLFLFVALDTNSGLVFGAVTLSVSILLVYFVCLDIGHNRTFFRHNIIHSLLKALNNYKEMTTFEQRSMRRLASALAVILGVLGVAGIILGILLRSGAAAYPLWHILTIAVAAFTLVAVIGTISWYTLALKRDLRDWNVLMAQIAEMYGGNLNAVNHVPPTSNLYDCAMQLNMIRTGIQKAVEEGTKADRTKVELITNVSHDIKTPLTSIISYVELLRKEPDLPPHVMDYIHTISRKADRLSSIVQDVFEVSKAATGNITLNLEDLDIGKLLQQTFGEMDETLRASQLAWRIDIPETPILVHADGQRLYRVFQNLIRNCAQYSLEGSRAYVTLTAQNGAALVSIRNISRNEITMNSDDLTARFVRGDQNRTTEGSGLGLSIAKSFTEACGGKFSVHTDGDLFIVTVQFPLAAKRPAAPVQVSSPSGGPGPSAPTAVPVPQGSGPAPSTGPVPQKEESAGAPESISVPCSVPVPGEAPPTTPAVQDQFQ